MRGKTAAEVAKAESLEIYGLIRSIGAVKNSFFHVVFTEGGKAHSRKFTEARDAIKFRNIIGGWAFKVLNFKDGEMRFKIKGGKE